MVCLPSDATTGRHFKFLCHRVPQGAGKGSILAVHKVTNFWREGVAFPEACRPLSARQHNHADALRSQWCTT